MTIIEKAWLFAEEAHRGQKYGHYPYIYHLKKVYNVALNDLELDPTEDDDINILLACILHDVLEDTNTSYKTIKQEFGIVVADTVYDVTDELGKTRAEKKAKTYPKIQSNRLAIIVKICDRIANVTEGIESKSSKLGMYVEEHEEFRKQLFTNDSWGTTGLAWIILDDLICSVNSNE